MIERDSGGRVTLGKWEYAVQILIVLSLIEFAFETLPRLSDGWLLFFNIFETVTVLLFTAEYLIRIFYCRPKGAYVFSFMGIIDLLAILPFYLTTGLDLRSARAFRLFRLFRLFKLARYSSAMRRYQQAFIIIKEELVLFGVSALIAVYLASVGIYYFEHDAQPEVFSSVFESLWWAIVTLTTVGYGDSYPITVGGKVFTSIVVLVGVGTVAVPTGLFASALSRKRD
jgi:voltage-gated potassium channel